MVPVLKCLAGAQVVLGWCSNCARVVLKLCSAGAQIVLGWCSNCARLVLKLCPAGAQIVLRLVLKLCFSCGPSGARFVVPLDLSLPRLLFSFLWTAIFAVSVCFFCAFFVLLFFFWCFLDFFFCVFFVLFGALFVSACACFGGWYLRVNEVLRFRVRMGSGFRI